MTKEQPKRYCVVDHANKQLDRDRGYPQGRRRHQQTGSDSTDEQGAGDEALVDDETTGA